MPPVFYKAPLPIARKVPKGRILPLTSPDIRLGKCLVTLTPRRIKAEALEKLRFSLKRILNRQKERHVDLHATYAVTKNPEGVKMGQGKGKIHHYVARVPAGYPIVHLPQLKPLAGTKDPLFWGFARALGNIPVSCSFRAQYNEFEVDNLSVKSKEVSMKSLDTQRKLLKARFMGT
ncbi:putative ribosomal protein L16/L10e [Babesia bovis T2Bo]|uniref:Ribosomal protein L16, putative n=1 Tax=Babesia bovis TaxID=5865 RepID=A7AU47_BABBO|nr:putative ribosomal protein L16/L10e [Babesia bovis T2Bo]EDO06458.1 putative ribosomal protein L16/L10e [Babesia bovis T2Bo]|eukprot:XP_001610026.1 ribosomal protein L16 [Babesia bovis T2Bo]